MKPILYFDKWIVKQAPLFKMSHYDTFTIQLMNIYTNK